MKISKLIQQLSQQMEIHGDVDVLVLNPNDRYDDTKSISRIQPLQDVDESINILIQ